MKFPELYTRHGEFVLHSGQKSDILYDVNALLTDEVYFKCVFSQIPSSEHYIGIVTGGALMALMAHIKFPDSKFSMIKEGELVGAHPNGGWTLVDDVITTGKSLLEAISLIGTDNFPERILVALDRRPENKDPIVSSIFEI